MGRNQTKRQTTKLPFLGKPVELYRPTEGQAVALLLGARDKRRGEQAVLRLFDVLQALVVKASDWDAMEGKLISGEAAVTDFTKLVDEIYTYDWPEETPADGEAV